MKLKLFSFVVLLLAASSAQAHNMAGMPGGPGNTYAVTRTVNYYPNPVINGTMLVTYKFTGSTQQPINMCSPFQHQPRVSATFTDGHGVTHPQSSQGQFVSPCSQMNQTLAISFDLDGSDCFLPGSGPCTINDAPIIFCTASGAAFGEIPPATIHTETAITRVSWNPTSHATQPYCSPRSSPADYKGPISVPATWTDPTTGQGPAGFQDWEAIGTDIVINGSSQAWVFPPTYDNASGRNVLGTYPPVLPDCTNSAAGIFPPTFPF